MVGQGSAEPWGKIYHLSHRVIRKWEQGARIPERLLGLGPCSGAALRPDLGEGVRVKGLEVSELISVELFMSRELQKGWGKTMNDKTPLDWKNPFRMGATASAFDSGRLFPVTIMWAPGSIQTIEASPYLAGSIAPLITSPTVVATPGAARRPSFPLLRTLLAICLQFLDDTIAWAISG